VRKAVVVSLLALSLSIPAAPALAAHGPQSPAVSKVSHAKPAKAVKVRFVAAGRLVSADAAAGTLTFRVQGGKDKALRKQLLTVTVASTTVVRRNGVLATLSDLVAGDHVNISGLRTGTAYAAVRVAVEGLVIPAPTPTETAAPTVAPAPAPASTSTEGPTPTATAASPV
jgi:hypothetical protein